MKIETEFSCGDKGFVWDGDGGVRLLTVGEVRVIVTDTPGIEQDGIQFDNYKAASAYKEEYMCVETGIGSGSLYTLGVHIFREESDCIAANAENIARVKADREDRAKRQRDGVLSREASLRRQLAEIEALKQESTV